VTHDLAAPTWVRTLTLPSGGLNSTHPTTDAREKYGLESVKLEIVSFARRCLLPLFVLVCLTQIAIAVTAAAPAPPVKAPAAPKISATVRRWMRTMTLREEVAQLVFVAFNGEAPNSRTREYRRLVRLVHDVKVGGLILVNWSNGRVLQRAEPYAVASFINRMQRQAKTPLMVAGDFERGASMRVDGTTVFPHAMAFGAAGDPKLARAEGEITAREARALGVQWIYFPVADVNNNPDNPIINIRSYGEDPAAVSEMVKAFIEGAHADRKNPVLATVKHFPGHGDTSTDTHINLAVITADRERLERVELVPFRAAIAAGVDSVMTAHIAVPALAPPDLPATLSHEILTDLLRGELGFNGLVVTDALEMASIVKTYGSGEAAVRALEAGADTLLMPADADAAIKAVVGAVEDGRLKRARIRESVARILAAKERVGLARKRFADVEAIGDVVDAPEAAETAREAATRALTLVRNNGAVVPLREPSKTCWVTLPESRFSNEGMTLSQEVKRRAPQAQVTLLDPSLPREAVEQAVGQLGDCGTFAVAAFSSAAAYRGALGLAGEQPRAMEMILATGKPVILMAFGNPYLLRSYPDVPAYLAAFSTVAPSEAAAVRALFGETAITGHLPVTIPNLAALGEGIQLDATHR
jgi:beta-N-acetylhexosaminidase